MSRSPYFFVERYNKERKVYELQHPLVWNYNHTKRVEADLFPYNGCHELFSIVEQKNNYSFPPMSGIHFGLPDGVCEEIQKEYDKYKKNEDEDEVIFCNDWTPEASWFTYADLYIYYLKFPKVLDPEDYYDPEEEEADVGAQRMIDNPIVLLKDRVDAFLEVMDGWDWRDDYSLIRIVFWIS